MAKGRPGGNPNITEYGFKQKYEWSEPCTEKMTIRMPPSMKQAIKDGRIKNWQEIARQAIAEDLGWLDSEANETPADSD
ncbi:hypothetical protein SPB21_03190 [Leptothoe sp. ISB3NOV94-8A]|uniref:Uncharacterized protein n=1 Tax=Adonisia turfae CCMR0081 TaxID=2292702 RepID=A0A6M0RPB6_9CYAN|nr:hypothetical protein [Adonisia turfae]EKU98553.1 hypothetical protein Lepto7375DRAFT_7851 [Leptolyngbya sp. PCC 7375]MDV3350021.1 hypothetical protein [Leptothoe sp. LEGE 181152]NEZ58105.1 hypothetical protein [Adonisia turfae CCMR0081]